MREADAHAFSEVRPRLLPDLKIHVMSEPKRGRC